jgi:4-hydroxy-tetrahydrodipicolinate synthase
MRLCLKGDWTEALKLQYRLLPLMNINFIESSPIPVKTALAMMGMIEEVFRLPLVTIAESNRVKLRKVLEELKLV